MGSNINVNWQETSLEHATLSVLFSTDPQCSNHKTQLEDTETNFVQLNNLYPDSRAELNLSEHVRSSNLNNLDTWNYKTYMYIISNCSIFPLVSGAGKCFGDALLSVDAVSRDNEGWPEHDSSY